VSLSISCITSVDMAIGISLSVGTTTGVLLVVCIDIGLVCVEVDSLVINVMRSCRYDRIC
jgi:hypothetical protein